MFRALLLVIVTAAVSLGAEDELKPSDAATKDVLHGVIRRQLEAFRKNDYAAAYLFAAQGIKAHFPVAAFEKMVRESYPAIATSTDVVFGITLDDGKRAVVSVRIIGAEKKAGSFQYMLEREDDEWRIAGVVQEVEKSEAI